MTEVGKTKNIVSEIGAAKKKMDALEYQEAAAILNSIIESNPVSDEAYRRVGETLQQVALEMNHEASKARAAQYLEHAIRLNVKESLNWIALDKYYKNIENIPKALNLLRQSLDFVSDKESIYLEMLTLQELLHDEDVLLESLLQLTLLAPANLTYQHNYAKQLKETGKEKEALSIYQKIVGSQRDDIPHEAFSVWLDLMNNYTECLTDIRQSIEELYSLHTHHPMVKLFYAKVCIARGEIGQGETLLEEVENVSRHETNMLLRLSNTYASIGLSEKSEKCLADAIASNPDSIDTIVANATAHPCHYGDDNFKQIMLAEARFADLEKEQKIHLHYALGKVYDELGELDVAFEHYRKGGAIKAEGKYLLQVEQLSQYVDFMTNHFSDFSKQVVKGEGYLSEKPLFILGMPRSGTSLLEQVLSSNNAIYGAGELKYFTRVLGDITMNGKPFFTHSCFSKDDNPSFFQRGERYVQMCEMLAPKGSQHIIDKMPDNFKWVGFIHLLLPNAKIIHARRHPVEICLSAYRINFADGMHWTNDLKSLGKRYRLYHELMQFWQSELPKGSILNVRYEDMVNDLETQSKRIMQYIGMPWQQECLEFHKRKRAVRTASIRQVHKPIYKTSTNRWHKYEPWLKPLLDEIGDLVEVYEKELELDQNALEFKGEM